MAEKLTDFDFASRKKGRAAKYPWNEWLDGSIWKIREGEDFMCKTQTMKTMIGGRASDRNLKTRIARVDESTLVFQAYSPSENGNS